MPGCAPGVFPQDPGASFAQAPSCFTGYWRTTKGALGWPRRLRGRAEPLALEEAGCGVACSPRAAGVQSLRFPGPRTRRARSCPRADGARFVCAGPGTGRGPVWGGGGGRWGVWCAPKPGVAAGSPDNWLSPRVRQTRTLGKVRQTLGRSPATCIASTRFPCEVLKIRNTRTFEEPLCKP